MVMIIIGKVRGNAKVACLTKDHDSYLKNVEMEGSFCQNLQVTRIVHEHLSDKDISGLKANVGDFTLKLCQIELHHQHASLFVGEMSGVLFEF